MEEPMAKTRTRDRGFEAPIDDPMEPLEAARETSDKPAAIGEPAASPPALVPTAPDTAPALPATPVPTPAANISLEVFGRISGVKPDQLAGFAWYAKRHGLGPQSISSWRDEYARFLATPLV
jgi:hypothetical protein